MSRPRKQKTSGEFGPAVYLALTPSRPREAYSFAKPPLLKTPFLRSLTCFHAFFFPFCPLCWPPLFIPFSGHLFALFSPSKSALFCRAKGTAQISERGNFRMDLSTKFGKEIPSRNLREKRSVPEHSKKKPANSLRLQRSYFQDPILFFRSDLIFALPCKRENKIGSKK